MIYTPAELKLKAYYYNKFLKDKQQLKKEFNL